MDDAAGALRPLDEAAAAVERLRHYTSTNQLASAVQEVWSAVRRSLRARLRADAQAPDEHRLSALSETDLPLDDVVRSLRSRDRISLETAGAIHAMKGAAERAAEGEPRAQDADTALDAVRRLRADLAEPPAATPPSPTGDARPGGGQADDAGSEGAGSGRRKSQARPAGTNSVVDTGA
ncbi:MAG TPA: hypothetical protein VK966_04780, partial [Longimicrobiales bacterium]|nr:hypothetical protein [Longimicrobiales bacterium]